MPGLIAYNRRWDVGSDDFVFPAVIEILVRSFWLLVVVIVFSLHQDALLACPSGHLLKIYYIGLMALLSVHIVVSLILALNSMRGAIIEVHQRRLIPLIIYAKAVLFFPELVWLGIGTFWAFTSKEPCSFLVVSTVKSAVVIGWVMFVSLMIGILIVFDPVGHKRRKSDSTLLSSRNSTDPNVDAAAYAAQHLWQWRCKVICCCAAGDENSRNAFNDIAKIFTDFFEGLDLVPTDIAAGLILVQFEEQNAPRQLIRENIVLRFPDQLPQLPYDHSTTAVKIPVQRTHSLECHSHEPLLGQDNTVYHQLPHRSLSMPAHTSQIHINFGTDADNARADAALITNSNANTSGEISGQLARSSHGRHTGSHNNSPGPSTVDGSGPLPWMNVQNAVHFMKYAMASYGWPLYTYMNLPLGCCKLWSNCSCCQCSQTDAHINHDNCCECNTAAIRITTGIDEDDIIYASFYNAIYEIPFYVGLDHANSAVIVSIRGTLSLRDALTDLTAESEELVMEGVEAPCTAHKGILQAASYVHRQLTNRDILTVAFDRAPGYQLVVTGHSLGAGAATLLSILLKPTYPELRCFAFSPPGGLLSRNLARYTEPFVCSVVLSRDLVPRLSIVSMQDLKGKVLRCIKDSTKPKFKILAGGVWNALCGLPMTTDGMDHDGMPRQPLLESGNTSHLGTPCYGSRNETHTEQRLEDAILSSGRSRMTHIPHYPPGHIMYIEEERPASNCLGVPVYTAAWAQPEVFTEIIVSPKMVSDHLPDAVFRALTQLNEKNFRLRESIRLRTRTVPLDEALIEIE